MAEPSQPTQNQQGLPPITLPTRLAGKARTTSKASFDKGQTLRRDNRIDPNVSIQTLRTGQTASAQMRSLAEVDGLVSAVNVNMVATAMSGFRIEAFQSWTNEFSHEGLRAAETVLSGLDTLWNYTSGFQDKPTLDQLIETGLIEVMLTGGVGAELVLDSSRIPQRVIMFPYDSIVWKADGKGGRTPWQKNTQGEDIELNYPTVFIAESFKSADRMYALPMTHSGLQRLIHYSSFIEDMQRVLRKNGQPRTLVKLDYQRVMSAAPANVVGDSQKVAAYLDAVRTDMESLLSSLEPEDALVYYDVAEVTSAETTGEKRDYKELLSELSGLAASALKSNPSALGLRMGGSQNIASTESMLSMKLARLIQVPVETVLSRALTLAVRLYGVDAYIKLKMNPIDLRPKAELEAHEAIRQNRVLELLSYGRITDDEAQVMLNLGSLPESSELLSGTRFLSSKTPDSTPVAATNARNQSIAPQGSRNAGGKDNEQRV
jgi:hypothetical protein